MTEHNQQQPPIELPAPCAGPMLCAFGITLLFAGIVTTWSVAIVGAVFGLAGATHWWREVHPDAKEYAPNINVHPDPVTPRIGIVARLMQERRHRARLPLTIHPYSAGLIGGLIGGVVMAAVAALGGWFTDDSPWIAVNVLSGAALPSIGDMDRAQLLAFNGMAFAVGTGIHVVLSIFIGLVYGVMMPLIPRWPLFWAAIIMPVIWCGFTMASISVVNPAMAHHVDWIWFIGAQVAFGLTCGWWILRTEKIDTMQNWSYLERMGMDSPGVPAMDKEDDE